MQNPQWSIAPQIQRTAVKDAETSSALFEDALTIPTASITALVGEEEVSKVEAFREEALVEEEVIKRTILSESS